MTKAQLEDIIEDAIDLLDSDDPDVDKALDILAAAIGLELVESN